MAGAAAATPAGWLRVGDCIAPPHSAAGMSSIQELEHFSLNDGPLSLDEGGVMTWKNAVEALLPFAGTRDVARLALQVAGASLSDGAIDAETVMRAAKWATLRKDSSLCARPDDVVLLNWPDLRDAASASDLAEEAKKKIESMSQRAMHRMAGTAGVQDMTADPSAPELLMPFNCGDCNPTSCDCGRDCRDDCCTSTGLSVNFMGANPTQFFKWHLHLYRQALEELLLRHLRNRGKSEDEAKAEAITSFGSGKQLKCEEAVAYLRDHGGFRLPMCKFSDAPPEGLRAYVDSIKGKQRIHALLQPQPSKDCRYSLLAYGEAALALGPEWTDCPFMIKASAEPQELRYVLPRPRGKLAFAMAEALNKLLRRRLRAFASDQPVDASDLLELSGFIVTLCESPDELLDAAVSPRRQTVPRLMARFLSEALQEGCVDISKSTFDSIVEVVANTTGEPADLVEQSTPWTQRDTHDGEPARAMALYGNTLPFAIVHGQNTYYNTDEIVDHFAAMALAECDDEGAYSGIDDGTESAMGGPWGERLRRLQEGFVVAKTDHDEVQLPLGDMLRERVFRQKRLPDVELRLELSEVGRVLALQTDESIRRFTHNATTPTAGTADLRQLLESLNERHPVGETASPWLRSAAKTFTSQGQAYMVSSAASVVAVLHCDRDRLAGFAEVEQVFDKIYQVADFVVAYLSCRLRLLLAEELGPSAQSVRLPLASRALMVRSTADDLVDDRPADVAPGHILPPMGHQDAFMAIIDLTRCDIGRTHGVMLAVQLKEGIRIARSVLGFRTSFMVWFVDHVGTFDLADAILRDNSDFGEELAEKWAEALLAAGREHFAKLELAGRMPRVPRVRDRATGLGALQSDRKFMVLLSWDRRLHVEGVALIRQMLDRAEVAEGHKVACSLKFSRLDTSSPKCAPVPFQP